jgi:hypothetical protein
VEVFTLANLLGGFVAMKAWKRKWRVVESCRLGALLSAVSLALLVPFVLFHEGNHTSVELWWFAAVFLPTAVLGTRALVVFRFRWSFLTAMAFGVAGMTYLVYIDQTNQLIPYMTWIQRGAPMPR